MLNISNLRIDPASIGATKYLTAVNPYYKYDENKERTNIVEGYRYDVALGDHGFEKISVKIPGDKQLDAPDSGLFPVEFAGLEIRAYVIKGNPMITATAAKINKAKS